MTGEELDGLKPDDIVVTSTPQQRTKELTDEPAEPAAAPAVEPAAAEGVVTTGLTEEEFTARLTEIEAKEEKGEVLTDEDKKFLEDYTEPIKPEGEEEEEEEEVEEGELVAKDSDFDWNEFSEEVGLEIKSDEDVVVALKELAEYKGLSPALQKAIEIERENGDVALYLKALANDPKNLSDRDALWEQYVAENPKRVSANPKFARLDFDRKQDKEFALLVEYEKLPASEREDFLAEHKADLEYLTEKRKFEAEAARASLQEARDKMTFKTPVVAPPVPDEEAVRKALGVHEEGYKKALAEFDVVSLSLGKDLEFNVGLSDVNKKRATEWMKNPETFLNELGFYRGKINYDELAGWATLLADIKYGTFGERVRQAILDNKDIKTLESTLDAPGIVKTGGEKSPIQGDEWGAVAEAFEKKRLESKKR